MIRFVLALIKLAFLLTLCWLIGFIAFLYYVPNPQNYKQFPVINADLAVVLTGDKGRIEHALEFLENKSVPKLFISGVNKKVQDEDLVKMLDKRARMLYQRYQSQIILGYQARSTRGNAREVAGYLDDYPAKQVLLITSHYHIPRSYMELSRLTPDTTFISEPVHSKTLTKTDKYFNRGMFLMLSEYHKTVASFLFSKLQYYGLFT